MASADIRSNTFGLLPCSAPNREKNKQVSYSSRPLVSSSRRLTKSPSISKNGAEYKAIRLLKCRQISDAKASLGSTPVASRITEMTLDFDNDDSPRLSSSSIQSAMRSESSASSSSSILFLNRLQHTARRAGTLFGLCDDFGRLVAVNDAKRLFQLRISRSQKISDHSLFSVCQIVGFS